VKKEPALKTLTVQVNYSGLTIPTTVYLTNVPWPKDPLEDQERFLQEEKSATIPASVRQSVRNLQKLAYQNNVSFVDLVAYALRANVVSANSKATLTKKKNQIVRELTNNWRRCARISGR
jgi:hypothetical protein